MPNLMITGYYTVSLIDFYYWFLKLGRLRATDYYLYSQVTKCRIGICDIINHSFDDRDSFRYNPFYVHVRLKMYLQKYLSQDPAESVVEQRPQTLLHRREYNQDLDIFWLFQCKITLSYYPQLIWALKALVYIVVLVKHFTSVLSCSCSIFSKQLHMPLNLAFLRGFGLDNPSHTFNNPCNFGDGGGRRLKQQIYHWD